MLSDIRAKIYSLKDNPTLLSVLLISGLTLGSKVLGFARNIVLTKYDPIFADIFANADKISGTIITIFLTGALASSVLPVASKILIQKNEKELEKYFGVILALLIGFLFLVCMGVWIATPWILENINKVIWNSYLTKGYLDQYILVSRLSLVTCFNFGLQGLFGVILNIKKRFFIFALSGIITNLGCIAGGLLGLQLAKQSMVPMISGLILGGTISTLLYVWETKKSGFYSQNNNSNEARLQENWEVANPTKAFESKQNMIEETQEIQIPHWITKIDNLQFTLQDNFQTYKPEIISTIKSMLPRFLILDALLVASLALLKIQKIDGQAITFEIATSIQAVFFIFVTALSTIFFPNLSETLQNKSNNQEMFWNQLTKYLKNAMILGFVLSIAAIIFSPVVVYVFQILGKNQPYLQSVVGLVQIGAFALFFQSIKEILSKYMFTKEKIIAPVAVAIAALNCQLIYIFGLNSLQILDINIILMTSLIVNYMTWSLLGMYIVRLDYRNLS
jgi:peptidoglycan biosynthesis protein MviN/MurJ (putative lipid II flippase)